MDFLKDIQSLLTNDSFLLLMITLLLFYIAKAMDNIVHILFEIQDNTNNLN